MAPTICLFDHNESNASDTSCSRSRLTSDRVSITRRKTKKINQSPSLTASSYISSNKCSPVKLADHPTHSHVPEATLPGKPMLKRKFVYKDLQKLCELVARTKSLAVRNYVLEVMIDSMQHSVQNLPQSSLNKSKSRSNVKDLKELSCQELTPPPSDELHVQEESSCSGNDRIESLPSE